MRRVRLAAPAILLAALAGCLPADDPGPADGPRRALESLPVIDRPGGDSGYRRAAFGPAWADTDHNSCNQRDDALFRTVDTGLPYRAERQGDCPHDMIAGTWRDPYTGAVLTFDDLKDQAQAQAIPVDHIVALAVAWRYGAASWDDARRLEFANDLDNLQPTSARLNQSKGGHDAATWRPPTAGQCAYATRYVRIKARYRLAVDDSEKQALREMLATC